MRWTEQINKRRTEERTKRDPVFFKWNGETYSFPAFTLPSDEMLFKRVIAKLAGGKRTTGLVIGRIEDWRYGRIYYLIIQESSGKIIRAGKVEVLNG